MPASTLLLDTWTAVHYLYGVHAYAVSHWGWVETFVAAVAWEIIENTRVGVVVWKALGDDTYAGDTLINSVGDITAVLVGWVVAEIARPRS